jgi:hypothetical protein
VSESEQEMVNIQLSKGLFILGGVALINMWVMFTLLSELHQST